MILDKLTSASRYRSLHPLFPEAFDFLVNTDLRALEPGRYPIVGERLFAIVEGVHGRGREDAKLECHRKYIDIQLVLDGVDEMGWRSLHECSDPVADYKPEKDIQFFRDLPTNWVATYPDSFCIFFPEDAHAPLVSVGHIRKVILKIAVE